MMRTPELRQGLLYGQWLARHGLTLDGIWVTGAVRLKQLLQVNAEGTRSRPTCMQQPGLDLL